MIYCIVKRLSNRSSNMNTDVQPEIHQDIQKVTEDTLFSRYLQVWYMHSQHCILPFTSTVTLSYFLVQLYTFVIFRFKFFVTEFNSKSKSKSSKWLKIIQNKQSKKDSKKTKSKAVIYKHEFDFSVYKFINSNLFC